MLDKMNETNKRCFLTVLGLEIVGELVEEREATYKLKDALAIVVQKDEKGRVTNINFSAITATARSADSADGYVMTLHKSQVALVHVPTDDIIDAHTKVHSKIQIAPANAIIDASDKFKK